MRIVSGKYKGRKFNPPKNLPVRPTTDFAKEGLFNVLRNRIDLGNKRVLDLFTGTGNMSFEFVSRGASFIKAIDQNRSCLQFIAKVCSELSITEISTMKADCLKYFRKEEQKYDLIFADPPYAYRESGELIDLCFQKGLLEVGGLFILEHGKDQNFEDHPNFQFAKKFGNVNFTFFANIEE